MNAQNFNMRLKESARKTLICVPLHNTQHNHMHNPTLNPKPYPHPTTPCPTPAVHHALPPRGLRRGGHIGRLTRSIGRRTLTPPPPSRSDPRPASPRAPPSLLGAHLLALLGHRLPRLLVPPLLELLLLLDLLQRARRHGFAQLVFGRLFLVHDVFEAVWRAGRACSCGDRFWSVADGLDLYLRLLWRCRDGSVGWYRR